jgi:antitoxin MazE
MRNVVMQTRIQKWGNSLGLRIPKSFAKQAGVEAGSEVDLSLENGGLIIRPARRPTYDLGTLLRDVTDDNLHAPVESGQPVGRETRPS